MNNTTNKSDLKSLKKKYLNWYWRDEWADVMNDISNRVERLVLAKMLGLFIGIFILVPLVSSFFINWSEELTIMFVFVTFMVEFVIFLFIGNSLCRYLSKEYLWKMRDRILSKREEELRKKLASEEKFNQRKLLAEKEGAFNEETHTGKFLALLNEEFGGNIFQERDTSDLEEKLEEIRELQRQLPDTDSKFERPIPKQ